MKFLWDNLTLEYSSYILKLLNIFVISKSISVSTDYFLVLPKDVFAFNNNLVIFIYRPYIFKQVMKFSKKMFSDILK